MIFANIILFGSPLVVFVLFASLRKPLAVLITILAGYLFLPTRIGLDLPLLPALHKDSIPALAALLALLFIAKGRDAQILPGWIPRSTLPLILLGALVFGAAMTAFTNTDVLVYGPLELSGLRSWDAFSTILTTLMVLLPFLLGRKFLAHPQQHKTLLIAFALAGFIYSFLALYEIRMSPQLNNMIYGFFPHSFAQHIRGSGFRPIVFLHHGLWLSIFFAMTVLCAFSLARLMDKKRGLSFVGLGLWLLATLALTKSLGAFLITLCLLPVVLFLPPRQQLMIAMIFCGAALLYPLLRGSGFIPVEQMIAWAEGISAERSQSFSYRVANEDLLLEKAQERPLFGWGSWGRNFVYDEFGYGVSLVADGYWVLIIGMGGWVRYLGEFGLLTLPAFLAFLRFHKLSLGTETTVLAIALTANVIDLIPNATITPLTWLVAGALWGRLEMGRLETQKVASEPDDPDRVDPLNRWQNTRPAPPGQRFTRQQRPRGSSDKQNGR